MKKYEYKIKSLVLVLIGLLSFALFACNEDPTYMGYTLLNDTISIRGISTSDTNLIVKTSSFRHYFNSFNNGVIHIGKYQDYSAISFVRFGERIKDFDSLDFLGNYTVDKIIKCNLHLPVSRYTFGDSINSNALSFKVYRVADYWSNKTNWDSLSANNLIDMSSMSAEFNGLIDQQDTMPDLVMDFDKNLMIQWFHKWYEYKYGDSSQVVWGLAFVPNENSNVIRQFTAAGINPEDNKAKIEVIYLDTNNVEDTLWLPAEIDKSFYNDNDLDTNNFVIQGGISVRGLMYFDISMIPAFSSIHKAELTLTLNLDKSIRGNVGLDSTLYGQLPADTSDYDNDANFIRTFSGEKLTDSDKFIFTSITSAIETWNRNNGKGFLVFHSEGSQNELRELDKLVFYGVNDAPDSSKMPTLNIIYSTRPKFKK